ncbi:uncharacterized metal-dependent hydrolase HI_0454-like [Ruditapes philippinarum]|uniref:uncharacterized metal-dependent hydrolase HI_0454-like n=1 Tax=Ruditapes philippinarum TaxID=129788 RepID=UPI00295C1EF9|nr:uncharacterized metal-dependent hydrolase HI_0454-like [Ruditapes philippinarum]
MWKEEPTGTSKDIRLAIDPSIQVIRSDCWAKSHTSSESIALLDEFDMEVEVESGDERKLLASPPRSPLKPKPVRASSLRKSWAEAMELEDPLTLVATAAPPSSETGTITQSSAPRSYASVVTSEKEHILSVPKAFDSHCHLDRTGGNMALSIPSLAAVCAGKARGDEFEVKVTGAATICCVPDNYPSDSLIQSWVDEGIVVVCGIHPKADVTDKRLERLAKILENPNVAGLGEVGVDHTIKPDTWSNRILGLERVLNLLKPEHILLLHARSMLEVGDEAILSLMYQLASQPKFPNTYFGFTSMVRLFKPSNPDQIAAVCDIQPSRMLLETDAPYFAPQGYKRSTPALIGTAAACVAQLTHRDWRDVLQQTNANAERLYLDRKAPASD